MSNTVPFRNGQRIQCSTASVHAAGLAGTYKGELATIVDSTPEYHLIHVVFDDDGGGLRRGYGAWKGRLVGANPLRLVRAEDFKVVEEPEAKKADVDTGEVEVTTHDELVAIFRSAVEQSKDGKGLERHGAPGVAFENQPIVQIGRELGNTGFQLGQARKKITEASRLFSMGRKDAALAELLGAMNYTAAGYYLMKEQG